MTATMSHSSWSASLGRASDLLKNQGLSVPRRPGVFHPAGIQALVRVVLDHQRTRAANWNAEPGTLVSGLSPVPPCCFDLEPEAVRCDVHGADLGIHHTPSNGDLSAAAMWGVTALQGPSLAESALRGRPLVW